MLTKPLANGISTDHPIPGLPFVDDTHLPLDNLKAIEAIGRKHNTGTWGRYDKRAATDGSGYMKWAYTDILDTNYSWVVTTHPAYGRTVLLVDKKDAVNTYTHFRDNLIPGIARAGGYFTCDGGETWFRPYLVNSLTHEGKWPPAPGAKALTADQFAPSAPPTAPAGLLDVADLPRVPKTVVATTPTAIRGWANTHLPLWLAHRATSTEALPLNQCILGLTAPELEEENLVDTRYFAQALDITAASFTTRVSRETAPTPQIFGTGKGGKNLWSRPVADHYIKSETAPKAPNGHPLSDELQKGLKSLASSLRADIQPAKYRLKRPQKTLSATDAAKALTEVHGALAPSHHALQNLYVEHLFSQYLESTMTGGAGIDGELFMFYIELYPSSTKSVLRSFFSKVREHERFTQRRILGEQDQTPKGRAAVEHAVNEAVEKAQQMLLDSTYGLGQWSEQILNES